MNNDNSIIAQQNLGRAIARMYIAAQGVSQHASSAACEAMEGATLAMRLGFNSEMAKSPYAVRAERPELLTNREN